MSSVQPINHNSNISFGRLKTTQKGNTYNATNNGTLLGAGIGLVAGSVAGKKTLDSLKTIKGKKSLVNAINAQGQTVKNLKPFIKNGISTVVTTLIVAGTAAGLLIGKAIDDNKNKNAMKMADSKVK